MKVRKQLFGSLHSVEIEFESEEFSPDLKGYIRVFERRHQLSESRFKNAKEFVTLIKDIWSQYTRGGGNVLNVTQRIASWLEEYLQEIGNPVPYDELFEFIRSGEISVKKVIDEENIKEIDEDEIKEALSPSEEIVPSGVKIEIEEKIDQDKLKKAFQSLLRDYAPTLIEKIESKVKAKTASGQEIEFTVESPYKDVIGENGGVIASKIINSFNEDLIDMEIESVIPYDLKVTEIKSNKEIKKKLVSEKDGLKTIIMLESLAPKELLEIEYEVTSRIRRVIQVQKENEIMVLKTFLDIEEVGERYVARTLFINNFDVTLNYIEMVDFIPRTFEIVDTNPDLEKPLGELKHLAHFNEVHWYHKEIPTGATLEKDYELILIPLMYRDSYLITVGNGNEKAINVYRSIISDKTSIIKSYYYVENKSPQTNKILIKDHLEGVEAVKIITPEIQEIAIAEELQKHTLIFGPTELNSQEKTVFAITFGVKESYVPERLEIFVNEKPLIISTTKKQRTEEIMSSEVLPEETNIMFNF